MLAAIAFATPASAAPLIVDHGRLYLPVRVNGVASEGLLDSAAEASLIDPLLSRAAGLGEGPAIEIKGSAGKAQARFVSGVTIKALGLTLKDREMVVTDLSALSATLLKRPTRLVLGREIFDAARLRIDIAGGRIDVLGAGVKPAGARLPLTAQHGVESLPATVSGRAVRAELDFGNGSEPLVSRALANALHLRSLGRKTGGGIGGSIDRELVELPTLTLAGRTFRQVRATVDELSNAAELNIGTSILRHFVVTTDFAHRAAYFATPRQARENASLP